MQMKIQHNSIKRPYGNKAFTSPKVNTTSDLVLQDETRGYFVSNAKNNKKVPIWTWLRGIAQCAFTTAKSQLQRSFVQMTHCRGVLCRWPIAEGSLPARRSPRFGVSAFNELVMSDPSLSLPSRLGLLPGVRQNNFKSNFLSQIF